MSDVERTLTPANENPWYILMTLYGEQEEGESNYDKTMKNERAWNSWVSQGLSPEERLRIEKEMSPIPVLWGTWNDDVEVIKLRFQAEWRRRNPASAQIPNIPLPVFTCDLSETIFSKPLAAGGYFFPNGLRCYKSRFCQRVSFHQSRFSQEANFDYSHFISDADFRISKFEKGLFLSSSIFENEVDFFRVEVVGSTWIDHTQFKKETSFSHAHFTGDAHFEDAAFSSFVSFAATKFKGDATFAFSKFNNDSSSKYPYRASFDDTRFFSTVSFFGARFEDNFPSFHGTTFHDIALFSVREWNWPSGFVNNLELARASCATIRHEVAKQGIPEDEHFFFRKEMYFAGQIGPWWQRLPYRAFGLVSNYGESIWRPSVGLFTLWLIPALFYMVYFNWIAAFGGMEGQTVGTFDAFSLSFAAMFKFLGLQSLHFGAEYIRALPPFLEFLTAAQTLGGIVLLFFLGLGLRTRFRLR